MMKKLPPRQKILEAFSAIGDGRVTLMESGAQILSSEADKTYTVVFSGNEYASDDPATYWQGYPGYPVIAVLILQNRLSRNKEAENALRGIHWNMLNRKFKRDYEKAAEEALSALSESDRQLVTSAAEETFQALVQSDIVLKRYRKKPE